MNYGLYLSAGGALSNMFRQDVLANNLANVQTVGFKPDSVTFKSRLVERLEPSFSPVEANRMLEQLGGGKLIQPTRIDLRQGELTVTGNNLDVAIEGEGFLMVSRGGRSDASDMRLSRDGRMTLNNSGELVLAANGLNVLDDRNRPITLRPGGNVEIASDGVITQDGRSVARLNLVTVNDSARLRKEGDNLLRFDGAQTVSANGRFQQGYTESSAVDPILALNEMISASKAVQANAAMMQYHDHVLGLAINTFGRVA